VYGYLSVVRSHKHKSRGFDPYPGRAQLTPIEKQRERKNDVYFFITLSTQLSLTGSRIFLL